MDTAYPHRMAGTGGKVTYLVAGAVAMCTLALALEDTINWWWVLPWVLVGLSGYCRFRVRRAWTTLRPATQWLLAQCGFAAGAFVCLLVLPVG